MWSGVGHLYATAGERSGTHWGCLHWRSLLMFILCVELRCATRSVCTALHDRVCKPASRTSSAVAPVDQEAFVLQGSTHHVQKLPLMKRTLHLQPARARALETSGTTHSNMQFAMAKLLLHAAISITAKILSAPATLIRGRCQRNTLQHVYQPIAALPIHRHCGQFSIRESLQHSSGWPLSLSRPWRTASDLSVPARVETQPVLDLGSGLDDLSPNSASITHAGARSPLFSEDLGSG